ncbi:MAG: NAD-dependent epimerase/dehydratase family protein [Geobacteraceae bacterium]
MNILITGGAGFIGSNLCLRLRALGNKVRVLDNLTPQVHGNDAHAGNLLPADVDFRKGDVRNLDTLRKSLDGIDIVYHLAAQTGVGQSMYNIHEYIDCNVEGTAALLDLLAADRGTVRQIVLASSRAVYGEGAYTCTSCGVVYPQPRSLDQLRNSRWNIGCPKCSSALEPLPTDEEKPLQPGSVYAISKQVQEQLCMCVGRTYDLPVTALRFFNVYGPGQSLINPYTGIITIFAARIRERKPPQIYEDGLESRDFVYITDIVDALVLALGNTSAYYETINVGSGMAISVLEMARMMLRSMKVNLEPDVIGKFRQGDIRHCHADLTKAQRLLGYQPKVSFGEGIDKFLAWAANEHSEDNLSAATSELKQHGLFG